VVFSGRRQDAVTAAETAIRTRGGKAVGVVADMTRQGAEHRPRRAGPLRRPGHLGGELPRRGIFRQLALPSSGEINYPESDI